MSQISLPSMVLSFAILVLIAFTNAVDCNTSVQTPYAVPAFTSLLDAQWPSIDQWNLLNVSLKGRLSVLRPWAAVCYASDSLFDEGECNAVLTGYKDDIVRENVPSTALWPNWETCGSSNGCLLNFSDPQVIYNGICHQGAVPPYSVEISNAADARNVLRWATQHHVKLTIRNTGHDYLGRSAAPHTLQVNTHSMKHLSYRPNFIPKGSSANPVPALTMGAGAQISEIYAFAEAHNFSAVLGACSTVGAVGGFLQGGGHGMLTPALGLGADHVLEYEIVTADGRIRTINAYKDADLFWAVRGGGPGSWGIVTSATVQAYPSTKVAASLLVIQPNSDEDIKTLTINFLTMAGRYANEWVNGGLMLTLIMLKEQYLMEFYWPAESSPVSILYPFFEDVIARASSYKVISNTTSATLWSSVPEAERTHIGPLWESLSMYGANNRLSSRLVPHTRMNSPESIHEVAEAIWDGVEILNKPLIPGVPGVLEQSPIVILGDMPAATRHRANDTGSNPGLYEATWHVPYTVQWTAGADQETNQAIVDGSHHATDPLSAIGITTSYQNEGSSSETDWQQAFYGHKYLQLLSIKQKYDPTNFFNTWQGVGFASDLQAYECFTKV